MAGAEGTVVTPVPFAGVAGVDATSASTAGRSWSGAQAATTIRTATARLPARMLQRETLIYGGRFLELAADVETGA
jgi:hypothetical protein